MFIWVVLHYVYILDIAVHRVRKLLSLSLSPGVSTSGIFLLTPTIFDIATEGAFHDREVSYLRDEVLSIGEMKGWKDVR